MILLQQYSPFCAEGALCALGCYHEYRWRRIIIRALVTEERQYNLHSDFYGFRL